MRRYVIIPPKICPFVHAKEDSAPACEKCKRIFSSFETAEFRDALNGDLECELGRHVARLCESCAFWETQNEAVPV